VQYVPFLITRFSFSWASTDPDPTEYNYACVCLRFCHPSDIYCVSVGADCNILKNLSTKLEVIHLCEVGLKCISSYHIQTIRQLAL
jgi:hypothetical protein